MNSPKGIIREIHEKSDPKILRDFCHALNGSSKVSDRLDERALTLYRSRLASIDFLPAADGALCYRLRWETNGPPQTHEGQVCSVGENLMLVGLPASIKPLSLLSGSDLYSAYEIEHSVELLSYDPVHRRSRNARREGWEADSILAADAIEDEGLDLFDDEPLTLGAASEEEADHFSATWEDDVLTLSLATDRILGERLPVKIEANYSANYVPKQLLIFGDLVQSAPGKYDFKPNANSPVPNRPILDNGCPATVNLSLRSITSSTATSFCNSDPGKQEVSSYLASRNFEIHIGGLRGSDGLFRNGASVSKKEHPQVLMRFTDATEAEREEVIPFDLGEQSELLLQRVFDRVIIQIDQCLENQNVVNFITGLQREDSPSPSEHLLALAPMIIRRMLANVENAELADEADEEILADHARTLAVFAVLSQSPALADYLSSDYELGIVLEKVALHSGNLEGMLDQGPDAIGKYLISILVREKRRYQAWESSELSAARSSRQRQKRLAKELRERFDALEISGQELDHLLRAPNPAKRLTAEQEQMLAAVIQSSQASPIEQHAALGSLVRDNISLAENLGRRQALITNMNVEDLCQVAQFELLKAAENFNPGTTRFSTYASFWINQKLDEFVLLEERRNARIQLDSDVATTDEAYRRTDPAAQDDTATDAVDLRLDIGDSSTFFVEFNQQQLAMGRPEYELATWQRKLASRETSDKDIALEIMEEFPGNPAAKTLTGDNVNDICQKIGFAWQQYLVAKYPSVAKLSDWVGAFSEVEAEYGTKVEYLEAWSKSVLIGMHEEEAAKIAGLRPKQLKQIFAKLETRWNAFAVSKRLAESTESQVPLINLDVWQRLIQRLGGSSRVASNPADQQIDVLIAAINLLAENSLAVEDLDLIEAWLFRGHSVSELSNLFQCSGRDIRSWQQRLSRALHCQILIDYGRFSKAAKAWKKSVGASKNVRYADYSKRLVENWFLCKCDGFESACERLESELTRTHETKIKKLRSENLRVGKPEYEGVQTDPPKLDRDGCLKIIAQAWSENETMLPRELLDVAELSMAASPQQVTSRFIS